MIDYERILKKYAEGNPELYRILEGHSRAVADKALAIAARKPELGIDTEFVEEAAMLHDVGIVRCDAPSIACHGTHPYICHGILGGEILRDEGLPRHARVAERHTGAGITAADIERQNLPLPKQDWLPESLEEKLICYADKFYSKSRDLRAEKPIEKIKAQMAAHGDDTLRRFLSLHAIFL